MGTFSLPYSVPEVLVNGQEYTVPYVTEEPSVVAAASFASKIVKRAGGFTCSGSSTPNDWSSSSFIRFQIGIKTCQAILRSESRAARTTNQNLSIYCQTWWWSERSLTGEKISGKELTF